MIVARPPRRKDSVHLRDCCFQISGVVKAADRHNVIEAFVLKRYIQRRALNSPASQTAQCEAMMEPVDWGLRHIKSGQSRPCHCYTLRDGAVAKTDF